MAKLCRPLRGLLPTGFTLVELLVALVSGAVLLAALLTALGGTWRLQEQAYQREVAAAPRELALARLRRELQAAVPPGGVLAGPLVSTAVVAGDWRHDDLQVVAAIGATNPETFGGDLVQLGYYLVASARTGRYQLVRTENRRQLAIVQEEPTEVVILDDVVSFMLTWYDGQTWQDGWDTTAQSALPKAVRVRVDFAEQDGSRPVPLELIVPFVAQPLSSLSGGSAS